jgi:hypothetical protein
MSEVTKTLLDKYASRRASQPSIPAAVEDSQRRSYRLAAAVLHAFAPDSLLPLDSRYGHPRPQVVLFDELTRLVGGWSEGLYTLKPEMRRQALRELGSRERMWQALKANPERPRTSFQEMWEDYLRTGEIPAPEKLGYQQLTELHQLVSWMEGLDASLPDTAYVLDLARRKSVLSSFEHLVISNFTGRKKELSRLREHVGVLTPQANLKYITRQLAQWATQKSRSILSIYGPGGIGRSALIGRFLWEHVQTVPETRISFAYLAFDQPTLRIETPFTLLVEATSQFELQHPELAENFEIFNTRVREYREIIGKLGDRQEVRATRGERIMEAQELNVTLYREFARLLKTIGLRQVKNQKVYIPVLLVFDTFEEVQYRDLESLTEFWRMLDLIQNDYPHLRVLISGRAPVAGLGVRRQEVVEWQLTELALSDRVTLLHRLGVGDPAVAKAVAEQVGGNPLSLRLAANVLASDPQTATTKGIRDLTTTRWLLFQVDEQLIQGQLYRRILDQIHDENVRKLAHPGMVLRRVNPEVILEVLAPVCEIPISDYEEAQALFGELRREQGLVQSGEGDELIYRPEIRRAMIRLLEQDRYSQVRELHRAAIDYYARQDGLEARAEEFYHRLVLDEDDPREYGGRWEKGIEASLASSLEEYPDRAKAWLAIRINIEVPREVLLNVDTAEWERNTTRKVQRALSQLDTEHALSLLHERPQRTEESPLYALEAKAYLLRDEFKKASDVLERGIRRVSESTNRGRLAELFWLQSQVALLRKDAATADQMLERAEHAIENSDSSISCMHARALSPPVAARAVPRRVS